jgi:hypothetical protein
MPKSSPITWRIRTSTEIEKPRYIIVLFQTSRGNSWKHDCTQFDDCKIRNVRLYLNSDFWPYENIPIDFKKNYVSELYEMYADFQRSYYGKDLPSPLFTRNEFLTHAPMYVIDCSKQKDELKIGGVDVRVEIDCAEDLPDGTTAFALILHDKLVRYTPLTNRVVQGL